MLSRTYRSIALVLLFAFTVFMVYRSVVTAKEMHKVIQYSSESGLAGYAHMLSVLVHVLIVAVSFILMAVLYRSARRRE